MTIRQAFGSALFAAVSILFASAQTVRPQENLVDRINRMTDDEQVALAKSLVDQGLPTGEAGDALYVLVVGRSALIAPIITSKIREVLVSPNPAGCFTTKPIDSQRVVANLAATIAEAGDMEALRQASKLLKLDERRFDRLVGHILDAAIAQRGDIGSLTQAYQGLELGDPAVEKRILAWADEVLEPEMKNIGNGVLDAHGGERREWARVLVERYNGAPTEAQWRADPLVTRLKPELTRALHGSVIRYAVEAAANRTKK